MTCTRCGNERKTISIFSARAGGHTWPMPDFDIAAPLSAEYTCGDCLTDREIMIELSPAIEFVLSTLLSGDESDSMKIALETARAFFVVRNNDPDSGKNRQAAVRALGL